MRHAVPLLALFLASCAAYDGAGLRPGVSSVDDVVRTMGPPAVEVANADGSKNMAYPKGYFTGQTFMVKVGADGRLQGIEQVLDEDHFYRITAGMTREDVLRTIGPPVETMEFARLQQVAWDYRYRDSWSYDAILSVMFDPKGIVVGKTSRRLDRGGDNRGAR